MTKIKPPRVLTVDEGEPTIRKSNSSLYGFIFSSDVKDWYQSKAKQLKRFAKEYEGRKVR